MAAVISKISKMLRIFKMSHSTQLMKGLFKISKRQLLATTLPKHLLQFGFVNGNTFHVCPWNISSSAVRIHEIQCTVSKVKGIVAYLETIFHALAQLRNCQKRTNVPN